MNPDYNPLFNLIFINLATMVCDWKRFVSLFAMPEEIYVWIYEIYICIIWLIWNRFHFKVNFSLNQAW